MPVIITGAAVGQNSANVVWQAIKPIVSATSASVGYPAINAIDPATWNSWYPSTVDSWIVFDFGTPVDIDSCGISAHNIATSASRAFFAYSQDNISWTSAGMVEPLTDEDILNIFPTVSARYWRVFLTRRANLGVVVFGKRLIFPHAPVNDYTPLHHARRYTKMFNDSIKGQFLGNRVISAGAETQVNMGFFERPWLEGNIRSFERHYNQGGTFFYASCPSKYPLDMGYCRAIGVDDILEIEWTEADKMATLNFGVKSYVG